MKVPYTESVVGRFEEKYGSDMIRKKKSRWKSSGQIDMWPLSKTGVTVYGSDLNELMFRHGAKFSEVADALGITPHTVSNWVHRRCRPTPVHLKGLRKFFRSEIESIVSELRDCDCGENDAVREIAVRSMESYSEEDFEELIKIKNEILNKNSK